MGEAKTLPAVAKGFQLCGGAVCLDFVNTVDNRLGARSSEMLVDVDTLLSWATQAGILKPAMRARLAAEAERRPREADAALEEVRNVRETMYGIFASVARGKRPDESLLHRFTAIVSDTLHGATVRAGTRGFILSFDDPDSPPGPQRPAALFDPILGPVLWSAMELLLLGRHDRVKACGDDECGWLFLDESRNATRRWCSMDSCGNRAKARRHYRRGRTHGGGRKSIPRRGG